jgi:bifunctional non-homologous end joining protein LigD
MTTTSTSWSRNSPASTKPVVQRQVLGGWQRGEAVDSITAHNTWFPELADMPADVAGADVLLDGEVVVGNGSVESFNMLLRRARLRGRSTPDALPASFIAFDLIWHGGIDWPQRSLENRRSQLRSIVTESKRIAVSRVFRDGAGLLTIAVAHGLEDIVAKDRRSHYELGRRSRSWLLCGIAGGTSY